jgi:chemotaxis protein methyltransferase CheR
VNASPSTAIETIGDADYDFLCRLVYERSRINLGSDKKALVSARVAKRLRALKIAGYQEYCRWLREAADEEELTLLVDVISTNHTHFFREQEHFNWMRSSALPEWRDSAPADETFRLWSSACSSGEEPYTLAIVLAEFFAGSRGWSIDATDISTRVLGTAERAIYDSGKLSSISPELQRKYFQRGSGKWEGCYRVKDSLRSLVRFQHLNLFQPAYPFSRRFHMIFCRNVMIYFDRPTQETLVNRLAGQLEDGGYLLVGHSESLSGIRHSLRQLQPAIYRKSA